ncbi:MAG: PTS sugar transporter subunit IIC [Elusimicrobiota bacterium]
MRVFWVILISSLINLDNASAFQFLISRPSFVGSLCGYIFGFPVEGFLIGVLLELVILDFTPVGGFTIPNGTVAACVSVLLLSKTNPYLAFFAGLVSGVLYSVVEKYLRLFNSKFNLLLDNQIKKGDYNFGKLIILALVMETVISFVFISLCYYIFSFVVSNLNFVYLTKVFRLSVFGTVFVTLTSLYFKFRTQVAKND